MKKQLIIVLFLLFAFISTPCFAIKNMDKTTPKELIKHCKKIEKQIDKEWQKNKIFYGLKRSTTIQFTLNRDGFFEDLQILSSSGNKAFDYYITDMLFNMLPFKKFPEKVNGKSVTLRFIFSYDMRGPRLF